MFPSETAILMDIARNKDSGKQLANRAMDVVSEYIGYLCGSLVRRGYITGNRTKGYQLTSMGRGTLLEFFKENEGRVKDMISRPRQLGSEYGQELDKLRKEQSRSSREAKRSLLTLFAKLQHMGRK